MLVFVKVVSSDVALCMRLCFGCDHGVGVYFDGGVGLHPYVGFGVGVGFVVGCCVGCCVDVMMVFSSVVMLVGVDVD